MAILIVKNLNKFYGNNENQVHAVNDVSFTIEEGEFVAVIGSSGSGKSTLLHLLGSLDTPNSGSIFVEGKNLLDMKEEERAIFRRRYIGFIFQSYNLISELTVEQNIIFPLLLDYIKPDPNFLDDILYTLRLTERRFYFPDQLSGGQQQRVAIGRALITNPKLILADEPTGNLDSKNSKDVINLLKQAAKRFGRTVIMITHDEKYVKEADRVFVISDGLLSEVM